jgi:rubredoxin---NAD+ reductase
VAPIVVVGSGLAGYALVRELRRLDSDLPLVVVTRDDGAAYSKPMLSNALAQRRTPATLASADAAAVAAQSGATVMTATEVVSIDRAGGRLLLSGPDGGGELSFSRLVLATGADPIRVSLDGDGAPDVLSVNDLGDYRRFRAAIDGRGHVTLLGAGLIGCEFANDLVQAGYRVDVVDPGSQPLGRLLPAPLGQRLRERLEMAGVRFRFGTVARGIDRLGDGGYRVRLADGETLATEVVLSAVGLRPRTGLAQAAGLAVNRGIVVDRLLATGDPRIFALGDGVELDGAVLPYVMPLMHQARALAATLAGTPTEVRYPSMPVSVKTPCAPVVVVAPPADAIGEWVVDLRDDGAEATFVGADGRLAGFALLGAATGSRSAMTRRLAEAG